MPEFFKGNGALHYLYRPEEGVSVEGMNNKCYFYSSINRLLVCGMNQIIYANYENSKVNEVSISGMNNCIYINSRSRNIRQYNNGMNCQIIFTDIKPNDEDYNNIINIKHNINSNHNNNVYENNSNDNNSNNMNNDNVQDSKVSNSNSQNNEFMLLGESNEQKVEESNENGRDQNSKDNNMNQDNKSILQNQNGPEDNIKEKILNELPKFCFKDRLNYDVKQGDLCGICEQKFKNDDIVRRLKCGHIYHIKCLRKFSETQEMNDKFPMCLSCLKKSLFDK